MVDHKDSNFQFGEYTFRNSPFKHKNIPSTCILLVSMIKKIHNTKYILKKIENMKSHYDFSKDFKCLHLINHKISISTLKIIAHLFMYTRHIIYPQKMLGAHMVSWIP